MDNKEKKLEIVYIKIGEIKPNEYNPKQMTKKEAEGLEESIRIFGLVDPLVLNNASGRENILIGGHQRLEIAKKLKYEEVPVVYLTISNIDLEKELCVRLTKNTGSWNLDMLANFDEELLKKTGFSENELKKVFKLQDEKPEVAFTEELLEKHNYIVLYFENEMDFLNLQTVFPLTTVKALDATDTYKRQGVGRIVNGVDFINALKNANNT